MCVACMLKILTLEFLQMFGAIIISGFFSSGLSSFKLEQDGARFDLFFRLDAIKAYLVRWPRKIATIISTILYEIFRLASRPIKFMPRRLWSITTCYGTTGRESMMSVLCLSYRALSLRTCSMTFAAKCFTSPPLQRP